MIVKNDLNDLMEIDGITYKNDSKGLMEVPDEIGLMLIKSFGFIEVSESKKKTKKSKED